MQVQRHAVAFTFAAPKTGGAGWAVYRFKKIVPAQEKPQFEAILHVGGVTFRCVGQLLRYWSGQRTAVYPFIPLSYERSFSIKTSGGRHIVWALTLEDGLKLGDIRKHLVEELGYEETIQDLPDNPLD